MVLQDFRPFLGLQIAIRGGCFVNHDMTEYLKGIQGCIVTGKAEDKLSVEDLKSFRRLVAQLRWPAHLVLPEFLFDFLAQRVGQATVGDLKMANALRDKMVQGAKEGRDRQGFSFVLFRGDPWMATFFDASFGKTSSKAAQRGEFHCRCCGSQRKGDGFHR